MKYQKSIILAVKANSNVVKMLKLDLCSSQEGECLNKMKKGRQQRVKTYLSIGTTFDHPLVFAGQYLPFSFKYWQSVLVYDRLVAI